MKWCFIVKRKEKLKHNIFLKRFGPKYTLLIKWRSIGCVLWNLCFWKEKKFKASSRICAFKITQGILSPTVETVNDSWFSQVFKITPSPTAETVNDSWISSTLATLPSTNKMLTQTMPMPPVKYAYLRSHKASKGVHDV